MMHRLNTFYAYALLRHNYDEYLITNPLDLLVPIMERILRIEKPAEIHPSVLQQWILESWGFRVPQHVIRFLLRRLAQRKTAELARPSWFYVANPEVEAQIAAQEQAARATYDRLITKIRLECLRLRIDLDPDDVLRRFLDMGAFALFDAADKTRPDRDDERANRVIVSVTGMLHTRDEEALNDLTTIVAGDMLYRAVDSISEWEYFDLEENELTRRMDKVKLFIDTGVLFGALGMMGEERQDATSELLEMARYVGCELYAFFHTLEEMAESIRAASTRMANFGEPFGPVIDYALAQGLGPADLLEKASLIQNEVVGLGVKAIEPPPRTEELGIDERQLDWQVEIDVKQDNPTARRRDVDSLTAI